MKLICTFKKYYYVLIADIDKVTFFSYYDYKLYWYIAAISYRHLKFPDNRAIRKQYWSVIRVYCAKDIKYTELSYH